MPAIPVFKGKSIAGRRGNRPFEYVSVVELGQTNRLCARVKGAVKGGIGQKRFRDAVGTRLARLRP